MIAVRGRWTIGLLAVAAVAAVLVVIAVRSDTAKDAEGAPDQEPATVQPIKGTDVAQVTLSKDAARRLGIQTAPIAAGTLGRRARRETVIPYDAVIYAADGSTFAYTSPKPLIFVRAQIRVGDIRGDAAQLLSGPPKGTAVVTVGSQELYGTEYEVEED